MTAKKIFASRCASKCLTAKALMWFAFAGVTTGAAQARAQRGVRPSSRTTGEQAAARADATSFRKKIDAILTAAKADKAYWGICVMDRDSGETLYELNGDRFFTPASNAKIVTTAFALAELGTDYRFHTTLESKFDLGADGRLAGDLVLAGRGDPDLSNRKFPYESKAEREGATDKVLAEMADAAVAEGLREVDGNVLADDSYFPYDPYPSGWNVGDIFFTFGAPVSAIDFNDNSFSIDVQGGARVGDPATFTIDPPAAGDFFGREIVTAASSGQPDFSVVRQPGMNFILLRGLMPLGHAPIRLNFAMTQPAEVAAATLKQLLEARGVRVTGGVGVQHAPPPQRSANGVPGTLTPNALTLSQQTRAVLAEHVSSPLLESVRLTNKISQNLHAELFLRTVAREKAGVGTIDEGLALEQDFLRGAGIADGDIELSDGSGLARDDLVTPRAMVKLLSYAVRQSWGPDFLATLPVAGVDGTIEDRMKEPKVSGLIQAKTGSFEHVHALSGYATSMSGEYLVFSIFANNDTERGRNATSSIDAIGSAMIETLGVPARAKIRK